MEFYLSGILALLLWAFSTVRDPDRGVAVALAATSFGMLAPFKLPIGGMTPTVAHVMAAGGVGVAMILAAVAALRGRPVAAPRAALPLALFAVYAVFASFVLVRVFQGEFLVFSFAREAFGERVSVLFPGRIVPLAPSPGNISQTAYLLLSVGFFLIVNDVARRRGVDFILDALRLAALANLALGAISALAPDLLSPIRTASYALLDEHRIAGMRRIIGGFPEASSFGGQSAALAAIFVARGVAARDGRDIALGAASALAALSALSSTGIIGVAALGLFVLGQLGSVRASAAVMFGTSAAALAIVGAIAPVALGLSFDQIATILDTLVFSKAETASGLERGAMALGGFRVLFETYGLGAGVGSVRANGFLSALLGSTGLPGLAFFTFFLWAAFVSGRARDLAARRGAQAGAVAIMAGALASSFSVDPGLLFMACAAVSLASREPLTAIGAPLNAEILNGRAAGLKSPT